MTIKQKKEKGSSKEKLSSPDTAARMNDILNMFSSLQITIPEDLGGGIVSFSQEEIEKNIKKNVSFFINYTIPTLEKIIPERFILNLKNLGLKSSRQWKECLLKQSSLFYQSPEIINFNITRAAELLGIERPRYIEAALKRPSLFAFSPETIDSNITKAAELLGIERPRYIEAALKQPPLFYQSPETINFNITKAAELLGIERPRYIEAALNQPPLFAFSPETINFNITRAAELLGIERPRYIEAALKQPSLFASSPEIIRAKFDIYFALTPHSEREKLIDKLLNFPSYFIYAPERIMALYAFLKLSHNLFDLNLITKNPLTLAKKKLSSEQHETFLILYNYFKQLFERRRRIKRRIGDVNLEVKTIQNHLNWLIQYFGQPEEYLTPEALNKINELEQKIRTKKLKPS